ncbi:MAG: LamG domain-containing protein [Desulfobacterales bacterium]|nr:MAG: LamG domain-containing protein [Desulfobacterales bacterium]
MNIKRELATRGDNKILVLVTQFVLILVLIAVSTLAGIPSAQAAPSGQALRFDGNDDYGGVPVISPGPLPGGLSLGAFTVEAWIKPAALSARRSAEAAILRAADVGPPDKGDIEASQNSFAMILRLNKNQASNEWGLKVCTPSCTDVTSAGDLTLEWQHLVATWDGSDVTLYRNGDFAVSQSLSGSMPPILHFVIGRLVASIYAEADEIALWNFAFDLDDARASYSCGVRAVESRHSDDPFENLIAYWQFEPDPTDDQLIIDSSDAPYFNGYRGASSATEKQDPKLVNVSFSGQQQQIDTDYDGIADGCDNCQFAYNPNQTNSDNDPYGDACDSCPRTDNTDTDGDGVSEPCENIDELVVDVVGSRANICFEYTATAEDIGLTLYFIKPTCFNTHVTCWDDGNLLPPANRVPPPVGIVFTGDPPQVAPNQPDVEAFTPSYVGEKYTRCVDCDLQEMYHPNVLANAGALTCEAAYYNSVQDSDAPTLWIGASPQAEFKYPVQFVQINIKPTSYPNIINNSGGGKLPVVIYGTGQLDATTIDPHSLSLRPDGKPDKPSFCEPAHWSWTDVGSPGTTENQGPPDNKIDLLVHFEESCLQFSGEDTKGILEGQASGTSITGNDEVLIYK